MKVKHVVAVFTFLVKLLERIARKNTAKARDIGYQVQELALKQDALNSEGDKARRVASKLKAIFE